MIDQLGYSIKAKNSEIQVFENSVVIAKGIRINELYVLVGSLHLLEISVCASSDKTKLWHIRLTSMNERGLKELSNQELFNDDQIYLLEFYEKYIFRKTIR